MDMKKVLVSAIIVLTVVISAAGSRGETPQAHGGNTQSRINGANAVALVGAPAPPFSLEAVVGKEFRRISLTDYRGKWLVLFFYPYDFSKVCPTEIRGFNDAHEAFKKLDAEILAVSADSKYSHLAWIERGDLGTLKYPLLSDFTKEVAGKYCVLDRTEGKALRGLFIIDPQGGIQHMTVNNMEVGRSVEETLRTLEALQTGAQCPLGWKPGQQTLGK
jgi:alkyl hydroperoxide reductase subunit AhpC